MPSLFVAGYLLSRMAEDLVLLPLNFFEFFS